mgnify:CR=1 FL=1
MIRLAQKKTQSLILYVISRHCPIGISGIAKRIRGNISRPTLSRYLKGLKDAGLVSMTGSARAITYYVAQNGIRAYDFDLDVYESSDVATATTMEAIGRGAGNHEICAMDDKIFGRVD